MSVQILWMMFMRIVMGIIHQEKQILIVFDDMMTDIMINEKFHAIIKELFIRCRKLNISVLLITKSYFSVSKRVKQIHNKRELQSIAINHSADIYYKDFTKIYKECTSEPCYFLRIGTTLPASDSLGFRENLSGSYKNDIN